MNVRFEYLYRDADNYKLWSSVVLSNVMCIALDLLVDRIKAALISQEFFLAEEAGVTPLRFDDYPKAADHGWHEFHSLTLCQEPPDDARGRDILDLIEALRLANAKQRFGEILAHTRESQ